MLKYLPELSIFTISLLYQVVRVLNDLNILFVPSWMLSFDISSLCLFLFLMLMVFRVSKEGSSQ